MARKTTKVLQCDLELDHGVLWYIHLCDADGGRTTPVDDGQNDAKVSAMIWLT